MQVTTIAVRLFAHGDHHPTRGLKHANGATDTNSRERVSVDFSKRFEQGMQVCRTDPGIEKYVSFSQAKMFFVDQSIIH